MGDEKSFQGFLICFRGKKSWKDQNDVLLCGLPQIPPDEDVYYPKMPDFGVDCLNPITQNHYLHIRYRISLEIIAFSHFKLVTIFLFLSLWSSLPAPGHHIDRIIVCSIVLWGIFSLDTMD